jgi:hypothetical protein
MTSFCPTSCASVGFDDGGFEGRGVGLGVGLPETGALGVRGGGGAFDGWAVSSGVAIGAIEVLGDGVAVGGGGDSVASRPLPSSVAPGVRLVPGVGPIPVPHAAIASASPMVKRIRRTPNRCRRELVRTPASRRARGTPAR